MTVSSPPLVGPSPMSELLAKARRAADADRRVEAPARVAFAATLAEAQAGDRRISEGRVGGRVNLRV